MVKYYTRACNFFYGEFSKKQVKTKNSLPLCGSNEVSFNQLEIFARNGRYVSSKIIKISELKNLPKKIKFKVNNDIKNITQKKKIIKNQSHMIMGILNMTPDSFSDGGKFNSPKKALKKIQDMINSGADIIDVGGESTRPGSKIIPHKVEWKRVEEIIRNFKKKFPKILLSIDTRKSEIIKKSINHNADIINDVSCFNFDNRSFSQVKNKNIWKVLHHMQGTPQNMQNNPKYKNVLLDIYDFFEKKIKDFKIAKYKSKLILDPGIGFGKNLKHNLILLNKISIFHSLGFPILVGTSRKRFINDISGSYDSKERIGGTLSSVLYAFSQGVKIFRVHNVREVKQGILVFEKMLKQ